jgi:hypothetical protein
VLPSPELNAGLRLFKHVVKRVGPPKWRAVRRRLDSSGARLGTVQSRDPSGQRRRLSRGVSGTQTDHGARFS